jgi:cyclophilin family peptidyl-prolyl cis-trans isomerase
MGKTERVYIDFNIGSKNAGKVTIELFFDLTPKTSEHFLNVCKGSNGLTLLGNTLTKIIDQSSLRIDIPAMTHVNESFARRHAHAGVVSLSGKQSVVITLGENQ